MVLREDLALHLEDVLGVAHVGEHAPRASPSAAARCRGTPSSRSAGPGPARPTRRARPCRVGVDGGLHRVADVVDLVARLGERSSRPASSCRWWRRRATCGSRSGRRWWSCSRRPSRGPCRRPRRGRGRRRRVSHGASFATRSRGSRTSRMRESDVDRVRQDDVGLLVLEREQHPVEHRADRDSAAAVVGVLGLAAGRSGSRSPAACCRRAHRRSSTPASTRRSRCAAARCRAGLPAGCRSRRTRASRRWRCCRTPRPRRSRACRRRGRSPSVALRLGQAVEVELAQGDDRAAGLVVEVVAVDVEGVGEAVLRAVALERLVRRAHDRRVEQADVLDRARRWPSTAASVATSTALYCVTWVSATLYDARVASMLFWM